MIIESSIQIDAQLKSFWSHLSDDESGAPRSFPFSRQRSRQKAVGSINSGQVEIAIPTEARNDQDEAPAVVNDDEDDFDEDDNIPIEPLKTLFAALFMVSDTKSQCKTNRF